MEYSEEEQESLDIDWYAIDRDEAIIHFASGGGLLPLSISMYKEDVEKVSIYMRTLPFLNKEIVVNKKLDSLISFPSNDAKMRYLEDFTKMSQRGFYSFDKDKPGDFSVTSFHLVSKPINQIKVKDLPLDIVKIINRTKVKQSIKNLDAISIEEINI